MTQAVSLRKGQEFCSQKVETSNKTQETKGKVDSYICSCCIGVSGFKRQQQRVRVSK